MADYLQMDAATVTRHVEALFAEFPELATDEALRSDMIEGETDLHRVVQRALDHKLEAKTMVKAMAERKSDLAERTARWQRRDDAMGVLIKGLMDVAGLEKLVLPEATISVTKGRESVDVLDVDALPQGYFVTERKADKTAIGAALKAGEAIPGAALKRGEDSISVRTK